MGSTVVSVIEFNTVRLVDTIVRPGNTTAYTAGDAVSDGTGNAHFTFEDALSKIGGSAEINKATIISSANQSTKLDAELWLFYEDPATVADNAAFVPTDAEMATVVGVIDFPVASWKDGHPTAGDDGNALCQVVNLGLVFKGSETNKELYGQLVARNAYTPIGTENFTIILDVTRDGKR